MVNWRKVGNGAVEISTTVGGKVEWKRLADAMDLIQAGGKQSDEWAAAIKQITTKPDWDNIIKAGSKYADKIAILKATRFAENADKVRSLPSLLQKAGSICKKNKAFCGAGIAVGVAGGLGAHARYEHLQEEKKECLSLCAPDDWEEYQNETIDKPTYKERDAVQPYDKENNYEELYKEDDIEDKLCTEANLAQANIEADENGCDTFCESVCKIKWSDLDPTEDLPDFLKPLKDIVDDVIKTIFPFLDDWSGALKYGILATSCICCCSIMIMLLMKLKG